MAVGCRGLGLGGTFCTSRADANDIDGPRSLFIATSMPDGASNSGLSLAPLGRQATMPDTSIGCWLGIFDINNMMA